MFLGGRSPAFLISDLIKRSMLNNKQPPKLSPLVRKNHAVALQEAFLSTGNRIKELELVEYTYYNMPLVVAVMIVMVVAMVVVVKPSSPKA